MTAGGCAENGCQARQWEVELNKVEARCEALTKAGESLLREYDLWADDANDGEFALWSRDRLINAFSELREALSGVQEPRNEPLYRREVGEQGTERYVPVRPGSVSTGEQP